MKKTITALLCIISTLSFGQVKLHNENEGMLYSINEHTFMVGNDSDYSEIRIDTNGAITIEGDTMKCISFLYKCFKQADSTNNFLRDVVEQSVDVANNLPDYWKQKENNCAFPKYQKMLAKLGYITVKRTSKTKTGCK